MKLDMKQVEIKHLLNAEQEKRERGGGFEINRAISQELFHQMHETEGLTNGSELTSGQNFGARVGWMQSPSCRTFAMKL